MSTRPDFPSVEDCQCGYGSSCICTVDERAIRAWINGALETPMTDEQRAWAVAEIRSVEGWSDYEPADTDAQLCRELLSAWTDFCRDKGLM